MPDEPFSLKLYRLLIKLYPAGFRANYAGPLEREFRDELSESKGFWALTSLWCRLLIDLAFSVPAQISSEVSQDVRHTLRVWANRPGQIGFAIVALAIGIGANTGVFSVVNALLLRSLPFEDPSRLALIGPQEFIPPHDSAGQFHDWHRQSTYAAAAALVEENDVNLGGVHDPGRAHLAHTSWNFFETLGTRPVLGRAFLPDQDIAGRNSEVVIGYGLWQQLFAGDPRVLGSTIRVDNQPLTIIGVAPPGFDYPNQSVLWKPGEFSPGNNGWATIVRLKPGVEWPQARAAFAADVDRLSSDRATNRATDPPPQFRSLQDALAGSAKNASLMLMAGVALILLIACTNVANLFMASTTDRAMELSVRSALGASRGRLTQQLITECLLLSSLAALAGLLMASWTVSIAEKFVPPPLATQSYGLLDSRVLGFAVAVAVISGLLFGVLPSFFAVRVHVFGSRASNKTRASRLFSETLVAAQVTLTIVLLAASISVGRAFFHLLANDRGYDVKGVVTVSVSLDGTTHELGKRQLSYFEEALARLRKLHFVRSASATEFLPLYANGFVGGPFGMDGRRAKRNSTMVPVMSDYFRTMGGEIRYGREFTAAEVRSGARVAVVNERFASEFGAPQNAVGRQLTPGKPPLQIVGVVAGMNYETDPTLVDSNQVFVPSKTPGSFFSTFVARVEGQPEDHLATVRDVIRSVDPQVPIFGVKTMEQRLAEIFARPKFYRTVVWMFAAFALILAVIGIYGIVSYAVVHRTQEMGVRMALGTTSSRLRSALLLHGLLLVMAGAIPGLAGSLLAGRFIETLIAGAKPVDPATSACLILFLAVVASASIWAASRRVAGLDIVSILRTD